MLSAFALPAIGGIPAGPELLIILLVLLLLGGFVAAVAAAIALIKVRGSSTDDRIAELEAEVERLRERVDDEE